MDRPEFDIRTSRQLRARRGSGPGLVDHLPGMAYQCQPDLAGSFVFASQGAEALTGLSPDELTRESGQTFQDLIHPNDLERVARWMDEALEEGRPYQLEYRVRSVEGLTRWCWDYGQGVYSPDRELLGREGFVLDVTEHRKLEGEFRHAQKLEALSRLAGGIAHDFNNLLTVILAQTTLLRHENTGQGDFGDDLAEIERAARQAADLTRELLAFARKREFEPEIVGLNRLLADRRRFLSLILPPSAKLRMELMASPDLVRADPRHLEHILANLLANAADAIPKGGAVAVETASAELDASYVRYHPDAQTGRYVLLSVSDAGHGMSEHTREKIFDPFFTTKESKEGTGLGLSTVYGMVRQMDGHTAVYSEQDKGTTFKLYLPAVTDSGRRLETLEDRGGTYGGDETILVMEDHDVIRALARDTLLARGYTVFEARSGAEARQVLDGIERPIDVLLCDVVLPDGDGPALVEALIPRLSKSRVLFMSGHTGAALEGVAPAVLSGAFLRKPFTPDELAQKIRQVLDRGSS